MSKSKIEDRLNTMRHKQAQPTDSLWFLPTRIRLRRLPKKISLISIETPKDM